MEERRKKLTWGQKLVCVKKRQVCATSASMAVDIPLEICVKHGGVLIFHLIRLRNGGHLVIGRRGGENHSVFFTSKLRNDGMKEGIVVAELRSPFGLLRGQCGEFNSHYARIVSVIWDGAS
jgi:hypothetical protein